MPVTAKLSRRFYEALGDDVANELVDWFNAVDLTYRTDLRELNELNFARFEAKMQQGFAEWGARFERHLDAIDGRLDGMDGRFAGIDRKLAQIDARLGKGDTKFDQIDVRFDQVDARFDQVDARFDQVDARFDRVEARLDRVDARLDQVDARFDQVDARLDQVDVRFDRVEARLDQLEVKLDREIATIRMEMEAGFSKLRLESATLRADLIKWMFLFWLGSVAAAVATRLL